MPTALDYDSAHYRVPTAGLYRVALWCGILPLITGTVVFIAYLITREEGAAVVGIMTIVGGLFATFIGIVCLAVYLAQARRASPEDSTLAKRKALRAGLVMASNFPVAFIMAAISYWLIITYVVRVTNSDTVPVERVRITFQNAALDLGSIDPGQRISRRIRPFDRGQLACTFIQHGREFQVVVRDYVDEDMIAKKTIDLFISDGNVIMR